MRTEEALVLILVFIGSLVMGCVVVDALMSMRASAITATE